VCVFFNDYLTYILYRGHDTFVHGGGTQEQPRLAIDHSQILLPSLIAQREGYLLRKCTPKPILSRVSEELFIRAKDLPGDRALFARRTCRVLSCALDPET
jgi:hypothetical protein